ncbi:TolC family protein [Flaviaesturariibacter aridisoli]|uniref:TolC family protein n=1 Tax=Flaviaesturariibacter aridisoli TaxID=2545761 RepID=A0A4V2WMY2_9BACT|nr:TolC family protein [Flaviaesturariibacter aridisoli]TCZ73352.1 TolC family protein [Flaviaesturariibacter aridisoli]
MRRLKKYGPIAALALAAAACKVPAAVEVTPNRAVPAAYAGGGNDTTNSAQTRWRQFFTDPYLQRLIDTALVRNQEVLSTFQEIQIAKSDILFRQGALRPTVGARLGLGVEKVGRYTSQGAGDASTEIVDGKEVPDPLTDITASVYARWEVDIWNKLRTAKKAAVLRYLSTVEGRNFLYTNLVAEVAASYNELLALDNQLAIVRQNIALQGNALELVKVQKEASRVTELAVQKFSAEVYHTQSLEFGILQQIRETENRLHLLLGHYPQPIERAPVSLLDRSTPPVQAGLPAQLLAARPDIRQAELELAAAKLDVQVARKEFFPSLELSSAIGLQAFKPSYLVKFPESLLYNLGADLAGPLINRNAIRAEFNSASARQLQALYHYERTVLNAYLEVSTQLARVQNLQQGYALKSKEVEALTRSIDISNTLFSSARADYLEVLMTQRDVLEAKLELVETKRDQLDAVVQIYRSLGGGWQ